MISNTLSSSSRLVKGPAQWSSLPRNALQTLLEDAIDRDRTTARRACLLRILWHERFLTRYDLITRVDGEPRLQPNMARALESSVAGVDAAQIAIYHSLSPADRCRQGCSISDTARRAVAYRLRQRKPELSAAGAFRLVGAGQGT